MNIFDRIAMLFRSNINAAISEFEQPEKMLNQIILDMRSQLVKAKQQVAAAIADEKRLHDQTRQELKEAEDWERRAMLAVQQNQDELAKQALIRRGEHMSRGDQLNLTWQAHKQETDRLKDSLRTLNDNIEEANRKKNLLLAKQRRADAQKRINETMSHEEFSGDKLAKDFKRLEAAGGNQSAEMLLIQLKQKMGVLPAGTQLNNKALGAGQQGEEEAIEVEEIHDEKK
jgi:phage shock protein A